MLNFSKKYFYIVCFFIFSGCMQSDKVEKLSVETFFKDPKQSVFHISPNGAYLSYLQPYQNRLNIFVQSLSDSTVTQISNYTDRSIKYYFWVSNDKLFYMLDKDSLNNYQSYIIDKNGSATVLIKTPPKTRIEIVDRLKDDPDYILIAVNDRVPEYFDVYKLNINTGQKELHIKNPGNIVEWISDKDGNVNLAVGSDGVIETIYNRESNKEDFKEVISNNFKNTLRPLGFTNKKNRFYALSNLNRDKLALVEFDCGLKKEVNVIFENQEADISDVIYSKDREKLAYLTYEIDKREIYFLDDNYQKVYEYIRTQIPDQEIKIIDKDQSEKHFIIKSYTDKNPGAYYLYSLDDNKLLKLSDLNEDINPDQMCAMKSISYLSRDGLTINGYLTIPKGYGENNLPTIVFPHYGPSFRNTWGYNAEVQFLANRGYAVLQVNYRGSNGYGKNFQTAGYKHWGNNIQNDIADGVKYLIKEKITNPEKVGVYGYGFGGYSALNQVILYPKMYKCAASYSGYINLFTYLKGFPAYYKPYQQMLNEIIGNTETDIDYLKSASPIFQVQHIKTPILLAHGSKDNRVNVNEINQFVKELRKRKISVNYLLNENESNNFKDLNNKLFFYQNLSDFFEKNIPVEKY
jgi:dipeptidyl aminopeptidase/acylaminoacyl peptidase